MARESLFRKEMDHHHPSQLQEGILLSATDLNLLALKNVNTSARGKLNHPSTTGEHPTTSKGLHPSKRSPISDAASPGSSYPSEKNPFSTSDPSSAGNSTSQSANTLAGSSPVRDIYGPGLTTPPPKSSEVVAQPDSFQSSLNTRKSPTSINPPQKKPSVQYTTDDKGKGVITVAQPRKLSKPLSDRVNRVVFFRKAYLVLLSQLTICSVLVALFTYVETINQWAKENIILGTCVPLVVILLLLVLYYCIWKILMYSKGGSICFAFLFTIAVGFFLGFIASTSLAEAVIINLGITIAVLGLLIAPLCQTKFDCTGWTQVVLSIIILCIVLVCTVFIFQNRTSTLQLVLASVISGLFCVYLVADSQMMMHRKIYVLDPDMFLFGAINLFVIDMFFLVFDLRSKTIVPVASGQEASKTTVPIASGQNTKKVEQEKKI